MKCLEPICTPSDLIFDQQLIGTWKQAGQETTWQFTQQSDHRDKAYRLVITDEKGRSGTFLAHLAQLEETLFLDLYPVVPEMKDNVLSKFYLQPIHTFLRVQLGEETLKLSTLKPTWLRQYLTDHPDALPHTTVAPFGAPYLGEEGDAVQRLLLTASTAQLQRFLLDHADTKDAFGDPVTLERVL